MWLGAISSLSAKFLLIGLTLGAAGGGGLLLERRSQLARVEREERRALFLERIWGNLPREKESQGMLKRSFSPQRKTSHYSRSLY